MSQPDYPGDDTLCLSARDVFDAVRHFLEAYWERGSRSSEDIAFLLSAMDGTMTNDGGPIDRAQRDDWLDAVDKVEAEKRARRH
jgi:hypothetical protein